MVPSDEVQSDGSGDEGCSENTPMALFEDCSSSDDGDASAEGSDGRVSHDLRAMKRALSPEATTHFLENGFVVIDGYVSLALSLQTACLITFSSLRGYSYTDF